MAFFQLVLKARNLEKARQNYEDEKLTSISISRGAKHRFTFKQSIRRKKLWVKKKVRNMCKKITAIPEGTWIYRQIVAITTDGTLENYIAKSFVGFVGGIFLTYIFFIFFVFQLNFKLSSATFICTILGAILTLGLAFSPRVRCVVFLILPQFFSKRGRQALMAYAFILAITGPVKNILHNTAILSESLACAQEQLKEAVKTVIDLAKQPFYALREAISKVIKSVKFVVKKIKQTLIAIKRLVLSILRVITAVFQWLGSVINMCNKKLGTPFDRCQGVFDGAVADCKAKLGPIFGMVCNITYIVSTLCYVVKPLDFICMLVSYIADSVVGIVRDKVKKFTMHMKAMFYVKVKFSHSFQFETNQSKSTQEVSKDIATEIRARTDTLFGFFDWMSFVTSFFIFFILLRALRYRYKWLTSERFDNHYITNDLRTIDLIRARQDKETVLPLNPREQNKYVPLNSVILIKSEKTKLARSAIFLGLATVKLIAYMSIDYSLYWVLYMIQLHGRFQSKVERPNVVSIHVSGDGYLSDLYRSIVKAFTPQDKETEIDTMQCLPDPIRPNLDKYIQITVLMVFCWLIAVFEPYGLRLRHVVLCQYYPDRSKQRAAWLYNHIIRSRGSFLKFARRQLRRKFGLGNGEKTEKVTFKEKLWAICPCLNVLFPFKQNMCLLCGAVERSDGNAHVKCPTPGCVGLFCAQCFADLQNLCTICRSPLEYGDLSDMSEEKDSSEDQFDTPPKGLPNPPDVKKEEPESEDKEEEKEITDAEETKPVLEEEEKEESREPVETEKEVAQQTDDKYVGHSDQSTASTYSYTYQDESPEEMETEKWRQPFKDVEAQKIKDDVTVQIFNQPLRESSSTESPASPFAVRARKKVRAKLKKRPDDEPGRMKHSDSSTSIADTESWSTEEVEEEEVIHVETDDDSKELLPKDRRDKAKVGRINRIITAVAKIPWLGREDDEYESKSLQRRRPSLMNRIICMLERSPSLPMQTYRKSRRTRGSSSSSSCSSDSESRSLLKIRDKRNLRPAKSRSRKIASEDESDEIEGLKRIRSKRKFATKQLPKYLETSLRDTCYFEVDETKDSPRRTFVRQVSDIDELSSARRRASWGIREDNIIGPCTCTSDISFDMTEDKDYDSRRLRSVSEQTDTTSKVSIDTETEPTSKTETDYSKETTPPMKMMEKQKHARDEYSEYTESKDSEETREDLTKTEEEKTDIDEESGEKSVIKEPEVPKSSAKKEEHIISTEVKEKPGTEVSKLYDPLAGLELYGVSYESKRKVTPARREVIVKEKVPEPEAEAVEDKRAPPEKELKPLNDKPIIVASEKPELSEEKRVEIEKDDKFAKTEPDKVDAPNENAPAESHFTTKVDKATDLPDKTKSTQTKFRKRDSEMKHPSQDDKPPGTNIFNKISKVFGKNIKKGEPSPEKKKHRKRHKTSKRKRSSCSDKSTFTGDEEYRYSDTIDTDTGEWEPRENEYSAHERQYFPQNYDTDVCRSSTYEIPCGSISTDHLEMQRDRFEMPMIKRYLPMYQSPELIEELKRHDRMKLIREEEAKRRRFSSPLPSPDSFSVCSKQEGKRTSVTRDVPVDSMKKTDKLPYQAKQAYKSVICELQRRTRRHKRQKKDGDAMPLIQISKRADTSKKVQQLYPRQNQSGHRSGLMKRLSNRIIAPFRPIKKQDRRQHAENIRIKREAVCCGCSYSPQVMSDISSTCSCAKESHKFITSTSGDEKTDNKSTR